MSLLVETLVKLRRQGHRIVFVSSGAIAVGMRKLKIVSKPKKLAAKQALAAVGQGELIAMWDELFSHLDQTTAQILLTRNDIMDFSQFKNAENTLRELLDMDIIPIVNENDTISTQEIKFGDNDTLSAITAGMCNADFLFLLTDVDCLYTDNPRTNPDAKPVFLVKNMNSLDVNTKSSGSSVGTGGMKTKLIAADLATNAGVTTIICNSKQPQSMLNIVKYSCKEDEDLRESVVTVPLESPEQFAQTNEAEITKMKEKHIPLHTRFIGQPRNTVKNKQFWLLHGLKAHGAIIVDTGCFRAITRRNRAGLLPAGVLGVQGNFHQMECVEIRLGFRNSKGGWDPSKGTFLFGKGRSNYSSAEIDRVKGLHSCDLGSQLEYSDSEYIVHRDNLAFPIHPDQELTDALEKMKI
ncbi:DEKNAAC102158 [Brettanomyces naardenensis]|uniref:DEKNAAC102158 n=1 Tax=Brettanomyces naardenensis TaxID=13370 RepID=A0A448YJX5_BRENA|nr:DEKNAAC102158 [Brettanomyces naardenensis]